jgi:hypothetical protein
MPYNIDRWRTFSSTSPSEDMLLGAGEQITKRSRFLRSVLFYQLWVASTLSAAGAPPGSCLVELPVYNARGDSIPTKVVEVRPFDSGLEGQVDLLTLGQRAYKMSTEGNRLFFPEGYIGRSFMIRLEDQNHRKLKKLVALMSCHQRWSLTLGQLDSGADVSTSTVSGRLSGCVITDRWWLRAVPMFGAQELPKSFDAYIAADGSFSFTASFIGQRYVFIVGKDKEPIKAIATDVIVGGKNELGTIDLKDQCPGTTR